MILKNCTFCVDHIHYIEHRLDFSPNSVVKLNMLHLNIIGLMGTLEKVLLIEASLKLPKMNSLKSLEDGLTGITVIRS